MIRYLTTLIVLVLILLGDLKLKNNTIDNTKENGKSMQKRLISISIIAMIFILFIIMFIDLLPLLKQIIANSKNDAIIVTELSGFGLKGILILLSLNILQVFSIFVPSTPIQILTGLTYGVWIGYLISITGYIIGNILVFILIRKLNYVFIHKKPAIEKDESKKNKKWNFTNLLQTNSNLTKVAFLLFLIPGVPCGILPYIFANTKIKLSSFITCAFIASTPATILTLLIGDRISKTDFTSAIIIGCVLIIISIFVITNKNKVLSFLSDSAN